MKKLLALVLTLVMAVCVFAACGEKAENPEATSAVSDEEKAAISKTAKECLDKIVALDSEGALSYTVEEKGAYSTIKGRIDKAVAFKDSFVGAIDKWEIAEENKEALKALAGEKADAIIASFAAGEVGEVLVNKTGNVNVLCKATLLDTSSPDYAAITVVEDTEALKAMTAEELAAVVEGMAAKAQALVVETDVTFQFSKVDDNWVILNGGISAAA